MDSALTRFEEDEDNPPSGDEQQALVAEMKEALLRELDRYIASSWHAAARGDPVEIRLWIGIARGARARFSVSDARRE